jgi:hypothetical protein
MDDDAATRAHARMVPLISRTDPSHINETVEEIEVGLEIVAQKLGIPVDQLWSLATKRRAEKRDAEYRAQFAADAREKELVAKNKEWTVELGAEPLKGALVLIESGGAVPVEKFVCSVCKTPLLIGERGKKFIQARFLPRRFSHDNKQNLLDAIKGEVLDGRSSTYVDCGNCRNSSQNFRLVPKSK